MFRGIGGAAMAVFLSIAVLSSAALACIPGANAPVGSVPDGVGPDATSCDSSKGISFQYEYDGVPAQSATSRKEIIVTPAHTSIWTSGYGEWWRFDGWVGVSFTGTSSNARSLFPDPNPHGGSVLLFSGGSQKDGNLNLVYDNNFPPGSWSSPDKLLFDNTLDFAVPVLVSVGINNFKSGERAVASFHLKADGTNNPTEGDCTLPSGLDVQSAFGPLQAEEGGAAADPVNTGTGNFYHTVSDVDLPAYGMSLVRSYNSMDQEQFRPLDISAQQHLLPHESVFGAGWTTNVDMTMVPRDSHAPAPGTAPGADGLDLRYPTGRRVHIDGNGAGGWTLPPELMIKSITWDDSAKQYTLTFTSGESWLFDGVGRLLLVSNGLGQSARVCLAASGMVASLRANVPDCSTTSPYQINFIDNDNNGLADQVTTTDGRVLDYKYDFEDHLQAALYTRTAAAGNAPFVQAEAGTGTVGGGGDGGQALTAQFNAPGQVAYDQFGNLFVADTGNNRIRRVSADGIVTTVAGKGTAGFSGDGGKATDAELRAPKGVGVDETGQIWITDTDNNRIRVVDVNGNIRTVVGNGTAEFTDPTDQFDFTTAHVNHPTGLYVSSSQGIVFADTGNNRIRTFFLSTFNYFWYLRNVAGNGTAGFTPADGPPNDAMLRAPTGVVADCQGNTYFSDTGNHVVRKIATGTDLVTTIAGTGAVGGGYSGDGADGKLAQLKSPGQLVVSPGLHGCPANVAIADTGNHVVRVITTDGKISTALGTGGVAGSTGDTGVPTSAKLNGPTGVAYDASNYLHVVDTGNNRIRKTLEAGEQYQYTGDVTHSMTQIERTKGVGRAPSRVVLNTYNEFRQVSSQVTAQGARSSFGYSLLDPTLRTRTTTVTWCATWNGSVCPSPAAQEVTKYVHDEHGRLTSEIDALNGTITRSYDHDQINSFTDRNNTTSAVTFDAVGRQIQQALPDPVSGTVPARQANGQFPAPAAGAGWGLQTTSYCTDPNVPADPRVATSTNAAGEVTRNFYGTNPGNANDQCFASYASQSVPTKIVDPAGKATLIESSSGLVTKATDADGVVVTQTWDPVKRVQLSQTNGANTTYFGYDAAGRRIVTRSPLGEETWVTYDIAGRVTARYVPVVVATRTCTPAAGCNFTSVPGGTAKMSQTYWLDGVIRANTDAVGAVSDVDISFKATGGYTETLTEPPTGSANVRRTTVQTFDGASRLVSTKVGTGAEVATTQYFYGPLGRLRLEVGPTGVQKAYRYDVNGTLTATLTGTLTTPANYATFNPDVATLDPAHSAVSTREYDKRGRVTKLIGPAGGVDEANVAARAITIYQYDQLGRVVDQVDGNYVALGNTVDPATKRRSMTRYDSAGREQYKVVDITNDDPAVVNGPTFDAKDLVVQRTYTAGGRLQKILMPPPGADAAAGGYDYTNFTTYLAGGTPASMPRVAVKAYDPVSGQLASDTDPMNYVTRYTYDADNRPSTTKTPLGLVSTFNYDAASRVIGTETPSGYTTGPATVIQTRRYNARGDLTAESDPHRIPAAGRYAVDPSDRTFAYYSGGQLKTATDANVVAGKGGITTYDYNSRGDVAVRSVADAAGANALLEQWTYNLASQPLSHTELHKSTAPATTCAAPAAAPAPAITCLTYEADYGRVATVKQPTGRLTAYTYWTSGRVRTEHNTGPDVTGAVDAEYFYNAFGERTRAHFSDGAAAGNTDVQYDGAGNIKKITYPNLATPAGPFPVATFTSDLTRLPLQTNYPSGTQWRAEYQLDGQMKYNKVLFFGSFTPFIAYAYNADGKVTQETLFGGGSWRRFAYNGADQVSLYNQQIQATDPADSTKTITQTRATTLAYTDAGRTASELTTTTDSKTGATIPYPIVNYTYDNAGQLTDAANGGTYDYHYQYGPRGERTKQTNAGVATNYTYADNLQLQTAVNPSGTTTYTWDRDGRRTGVADSGGTTTTNYDNRGTTRSTVRTPTPGTAVTNTETHDADGQLIGSKTGTVTSEFLWDTTRAVPQILETRANNAFVARQDYGLEHMAGGNPITGGANNWHAFDSRGSVTPSPVMAAPAGYDPFGAPIGAPAGSYFGYRGELTTTVGNSSPLIRLRARDYDPVMGGFTTRDPLDGIAGSPDIANPYTYVHNDPLDSIDPTGKQCSDGCFVNPFCVVAGGDDCRVFQIRQAVSFVGGVLDSVTMGHGTTILGWAGMSTWVDKSSGWYLAGVIVGTVAQAVIPFLGEEAVAMSANQASMAIADIASAERDLEVGMIVADEVKNLGAAAEDSMLVADGLSQAKSVETAAEVAEVASEAEMTEVAVEIRTASSATEGAGGRDPIFADTDLLINAQRGHPGALSEIRAGETYVTPNQFNEFTAGGAGRHEFLQQEGVQLLGGPEAGEVASQSGFQKTFGSVVGAQGRGDAALAAFARETGIEAVTMDRRLVNFITQTLRDPNVPIRLVPR